MRILVLRATLVHHRVSKFKIKKIIMSKKTFVLSLGGSLIVPENIDVSYLRKFKAFVEKAIKEGTRFVIVAGGGSTARKYRDAGRGVVKQMPVDDLDWIGIHATRLNAHLIRTIFRDHAHREIITNPAEKFVIKESIVVGAGYWPGHSTDFQAVQFAKKFNAQMVINLSNIDYVYTKDPKKKGARKIENISWTNFRKIVGNKWYPSLHAPFDPIASKLAQSFKLKVAVINGRNFSNIKKVMNGSKFKGTLISGN